MESQSVVSNVPKTIVDLSSLTEVQAATLKIELARRKREINMEQALRSRNSRNNSEITRGAYNRVVRQAKNNVKSSLFTVAFAVQVGLVKVEDVQKFIASASLIPDDLDPERAAQVLGVADAIAERIVMS